ncbi:MAG: DUF1592 domain-containing protein [Planctomycetes bacterium]|nr:DUF1592 domain-containing protein [Planctomycetota bacterium]
MNPRFLFACLALLALTSTALAAEPADFDSTILPFFKTYCLRCHDDKSQKGEFRLDNLSRDFTNQAIAQRWGELQFRIYSGEMPPKKEPQPKAAELGKVAEWISTRLKEGEAVRMARRGPITHYRLSREEYGHTVYDLLGVYFDVNLPGVFNDDPRWHGFDRIGSLLSLSPSHVERYFKAAETVLERAMPASLPKPQKIRRDADDGKSKAEPIRWLLWPDHGQNLLNVSSPGLYRLRIQLSGLPSFKGRVPHLALWHHGQKKSILGRDVLASEDASTIMEIEAFLPEGSYTIKNDSPGMFSDGHTLSNTNFVFRNTKTTLQNKPTGYKFFNEEGQPIYPLLLVDWVEMEGPILTDADKKKRDGLIPTKEGDLTEAREALKRFATKAWRRPATDAEIDRYLTLMQGELKAGENFRSAYRSALVGILTSKNFYYIEEGSASEKRAKVNDWELASRLSFFLWSSMPDEDLFTAARNGMLAKPEVLRTQLTRMLGDAKINRFTNAFPKQWLQLHRVGQFPADPELYPDYDKWLEESMVLETTLYFDTVFRENLPLREFITSDWTVLNPRLAMHYGMPLPKSTNFEKVKLRPEDHRGGLLTHASVLSLTSDGTRHRPVHRGVWVSEAIFGRTPPPPPPNVEPLAPTPSNKPKATIRNQLEAHATHTTCASCHAKIDPLGFAFDTFDAVGRWRTHERVVGGQGDDPLVDAASVLPNGRAFKGPDDFKQLLLQDVDRFAEAFVEQLATFALRRVMTIDDMPQIKAIAQASKKDGYKLRAVVENLVMSELFQRR